MADVLNWPSEYSEVQLRGEIGRYVGVCAVTGKRRVQTFKFRGNPMPPPKTPEEAKDYTYTTWLLDEAGRCRGDLAPCEQDWLGRLPA